MLIRISDSFDSKYKDILCSKYGSDAQVKNSKMFGTQIMFGITFMFGINH